MLKINEIFYSIQGEGRNTGLPCIFIRFAGCNKTCKWCDTKHNKFKLMTSDAIINKIETYPCNNIIFTGGEPTLQDYTTLQYSLAMKGYWIGIETNGTKEVKGFDWITISPKDTNIKSFKCHECKVVWTGKEDLDWIRGHTFARYYYLQPCSNKNIKATVNQVLKHSDWRLSLQCQKLINIK